MMKEKMRARRGAAHGKTLLLLLAVLAVFIGGIFAAKKITARAQAEEEAAEEEITVAAWSTEEDAVCLVSYTTENDSLTFEKTDDVWAWTDDPSFPASQSAVEKLVSAFSEIEAYKVIDDPEELSEYGLENAAYTVTLDDAELRIGDESAIDGYRYFSCGDGKVYLVDSDLTKKLSGDIYDYVQTESLPDMSDITSFRVSWNGGGYTLLHEENSALAYSEEYTWFMQNGEDLITLDTDLAEALVDTVTQIGWVQCVEYAASEETEESYGLREPAITVTVDYTESEQKETDLTDSDGEPIYETVENARTFVLEMNGAYAQIGDSAMIYQVGSGIADTLRYTSYSELLPDEVLALDYSDVTSMDVTIGEETMSFKKTTETVTDEDGETVIRTVWKQDGDTAEIEDALDSIADMLTYDSVWDRSGENGVQLTLTFHRSDKNYPKTVLTFSDYDSTYCMAAVDDNIPVKVLRSDVNSLVSSFQAAAGEE